MNMEAAAEFKPGLANHVRREKIGQALETAAEHNLVHDRDLQLLGEGGSRIALTLAKFPDHVAKVDREMVFDAMQLEAKAEDNDQWQRAIEDNHRLLQRTLIQERGGAKMLREFFGEAVLRERIGIMKVPVTAELLQAVQRGNRAPIDMASGLVHEVETLVTLQDKAPAAAFAESSMGIKLDYFELRDAKSRLKAVADLTRVNQCFLDCTVAAPSARDLVKLMDDQDIGLRLLLLQAQTDLELREVLKDFTRRAIAFTEATGSILDFIGTDNIRVYRDAETNKWKIVMLDARIGRQIFTKAERALAMMIKGQQVKGNDVINAMNAMNYTRLINGLVLELDLPDTLMLLDEPLAPHTAKIMAYMRELKKQYFPATSNEAEQPAAAK